MQQQRYRRVENDTVSRPLFCCVLLVLLFMAGIIVGLVIENQPTAPLTSPPSLTILHPAKLEQDASGGAAKKIKFNTNLKFQKRSEPDAVQTQQPTTMAEKTKKPAKPHHFYHDKKKHDNDTNNKQ